MGRAETRINIGAEGRGGVHGISASPSSPPPRARAKIASRQQPPMQISNHDGVMFRPSTGCPSFIHNFEQEIRFDPVRSITFSTSFFLIYFLSSYNICIFLYIKLYLMERTSRFTLLTFFPSSFSKKISLFPLEIGDLEIGPRRRTKGITRYIGVTNA